MNEEKEKIRMNAFVDQMGSEMIDGLKDGGNVRAFIEKIPQLSKKIQKLNNDQKNVLIHILCSLAREISTDTLVLSLISHLWNINPSVEKDIDEMIQAISEGKVDDLFS